MRNRLIPYVMGEEALVATNSVGAVGYTTTYSGAFRVSTLS